MNNRVAALRLDNQRIARSGPRRPADVVAWLGAVQAQEYGAAKWALALRMPDGTTDTRIERALDDGRILRTHVLRPTWHFVAAPDIRWMLELTAPRVHQALAYANRNRELDRASCTRATNVFERVLDGGQCLTRAELGAHLARAGLTVQGIRLALLTMYAELEAVICSGPRRGKQQTYALVADRAPRARRLPRDEALGELACRYFRSHGPATIRDFVWWSGLKTVDAKRAVDISGSRKEVIDGLTYWTLGREPATAGPSQGVNLLPIYDEYLVAYRDLDAVPRMVGPRGTLQPALIARGQVVGTWRPASNGVDVTVDVAIARRLTDLERRALRQTAARYGRFLRRPVSVTIKI
jgi:hypothetical protein